MNEQQQQQPAPETTAAPPTVSLDTQHEEAMASSSGNTREEEKETMRDGGRVEVKRKEVPSLTTSTIPAVNLYQWSHQESLALLELAYEDSPNTDWETVAQSLATLAPRPVGYPPREGGQCSSYFRTRLLKMDYTVGNAKGWRPSHLPSTSPLKPVKSISAGVLTFSSLQVPWTDEQKLLVAREARTKMKELGKETLEVMEWSEIGARMIPPRNGNGCRLVFAQVCWSDSQPDEPAPDRVPKKVKAERFNPIKRPLVLTAVEQVATQATSESTDSIKPAPVSIIIRPFSTADDDDMMEKFGRMKGLYKKIARSMNPPRHKSEVKDRIEWLRKQALRLLSTDQPISAPSRSHPDTIPTPPAPQRSPSTDSRVSSLSLAHQHEIDSIYNRFSSIEGDSELDFALLPSIFPPSATRTSSTAIARPLQPQATPFPPTPIPSASSSIYSPSVTGPLAAISTSPTPVISSSLSAPLPTTTTQATNPPPLPPATTQQTYFNHTLLQQPQTTVPQSSHWPMKPQPALEDTLDALWRLGNECLGEKKD